MDICGHHYSAYHGGDGNCVSQNIQFKALWPCASDKWLGGNIRDEPAYEMNQPIWLEKDWQTLIFFGLRRYAQSQTFHPPSRYLKDSIPFHPTGLARTPDGEGKERGWVSLSIYTQKVPEPISDGGAHCAPLLLTQTPDFPHWLRSPVPGAHRGLMTKWLLVITLIMSLISPPPIPLSHFPE